MKTSKFNVFVELENDATFIYNTFTGKSLQLSPAQAKLLSISSSQSLHLQKLLLANAQKELCECGIVIPDGKNEIEEFHYLHNQEKKHSKVGRFLLFISRVCNLDCYYCYENKEQIKIDLMAKETADQIISFIKDDIQNSNYDTLLIGLYGGEPLLNPHLGSYIVKTLTDYQSQINIPVQFSLTTNGYHLKDCLDLPIIQLSTAIHITFDGAKDQHDHIRKTKHGHRSYSRIMEGIGRLSEMDVFIGIRIHYENINTRQLIGFLNDLLDHGITRNHRCRIYLMDVREESIGITNKSCSVIEPEKLRKIESDMASFMRAIESHELASLFYWELRYPREAIPRNYLACGFESDSSFVFDTDGSLRLCGGPSCEGNVSEVGDNDKSSSSGLFTDGQWDNHICRECVYLPICGGPCALRGAPSKRKDCEERFMFYDYLIKKHIQNSNKITINYESN